MNGRMRQVKEERFVAMSMNERDRLVGIPLDNRLLVVREHSLQHRFVSQQRKRRLTGSTFLAGSRFTAVDAFFAPVVFRANTYQLPLDEPTQDYADCILNLPSMQRWYGKACAETWREASHEEEIRDLGRWVEDRRSPEYKPVAIGRMT